LIVSFSGVGNAQKYAYLGDRARTQHTQVFWNREDADAWLATLGW